MAITIESVPDNYLPATNPCEFTFSSSNTNQDNFSFIVRLNINGSTHSYHQVFPESGVHGKFNASEILRSYVYGELIPSGVIELNTDTFVVDYSIVVREKYGNPPVEVGSLVASSSVSAINGSLRHIDWINYSYLKYNFSTSIALSQRKMMSFFPDTSNRMCGINESQYLGFICTDNTAKIKITLQDVSGSTVATTNQSIEVSSRDFMIVDVSPQTIIADTAITSTDFDNAYKYQVLIIPTDSASAFAGDPTVDIIVDRECSLYDGKRLHWLNKFGVWESFTFRLYSEETTNVKSKQYQKVLGGWDSGNNRVYNRYAGENTVISKTANDELELNSDWIKEDVQQWLSRSLYESPLVYLEVSQGVYEPVECSKSNYTQKQRIKEGLIQENVKLKRTYTHRSQLG